MQEQLRQHIMSDLKLLGLPLDFKLDIRGYSKTYNGRYDPNNGTIIVYSLNEDQSAIDYGYILQTVIHESIHHYQWKHDPNFKRHRGIMHDPSFKRLEAKYLKRAVNMEVIEQCY